MQTVMTNQELNRALLARQMLLERVRMPAIEAIEKLVGLQAQAPNPPYFGLWTRIKDFCHEELTGLIESRQAVRIALMRSTIHLVSAKDCLEMRHAFQSVLERGLKGNYSKRLTGLDLEEIAEAGRALVESAPFTLSELGKRLHERWDTHDPEALSMVIRNRVPLVQVPPRGLWGRGGQATYTTAEAWLGETRLQIAKPKDIVLRYLGAFGPATVKDIQVWSGLTKLREVVEELRSQLETFMNEAGDELFDLPEAPRPSADTPCPPRFLGEFDNILLSHADRSRIMSESDRKRVFTVNGIIRSVILVDGFVRGIWRIDKTKEKATLTIEPFISLTAKEMDSLREEGYKLLQFAAPKDIKTEVVFMPEGNT
ncbi:winged helix DNA-binding domain-containing protein [Paenibacillus sp. HJL G12]|uniref:Winged helix DNA-binding domain-containing protein n=2 Tax=Paenibacillus dendrobii TaxID=2691084 RepID=A0A7X3LG41_9BACL|nr:winged helix DNA-binding domain-containing protein [Paenibacillus dendrobii]